MSITDRLQSAYRAAIFLEKNNKRFECTYLKASPQTSWGKRTIPFPLVFPSARLTNQKLYIWQGHPVRQSVSQSVAGGDSPGTGSQLDTLVLSRDAIHDLQAEEEMGEGVKIPH